MSKRARQAVLAIAAILIAAAAAVLVITQRHANPSTQSPGAGTPGASPATSLKPVVAGLIDFNGEPPAQHVSAVSGWVLNLSWRSLEPSGPALAPNNPIDQAISAVDRLDAANPGRTFHIKVRVIWAQPGQSVPEWVLNAGGGPVTISQPPRAPEEIPRFWNAGVGQAYDQLMGALAARYDRAPEVGDVAISRCDTVYAEPMVRQNNIPSSVQALLDAGYTSSLDDACQHQQIDAMKVWKHTHVSISLSAYQRIDAPKAPGHAGISGALDYQYAESIAQYCRTTLGSQCVLGNNELGRPTFDGYSPQIDSPVYQDFVKFGRPIYFQAETNVSKLGSAAQLQAAIAEGVQLKASYIEVDNLFQQISPSTLSADNRALTPP